MMGFISHQQPWLLAPAALLSLALASLPSSASAQCEGVRDRLDPNALILSGLGLDVGPH